MIFMIYSRRGNACVGLAIDAWFATKAAAQKWCDVNPPHNGWSYEIATVYEMPIDRI